MITADLHLTSCPSWTTKDSLLRKGCLEFVVFPVVATSYLLCCFLVVATPYIDA